MIKVVMWTGTGNTLAMAQAIAKGITDAGKEAEVINFDDITPDEAAAEDVIAFGCPAMGDEVLEEGTVEPFFADYEGLCSGKKVALFGSYGWGDGQWMRDWEERVKNAGAVLVGDAGLMTNNTHDEAAIVECEAFGATIANA